MPTGIICDLAAPHHTVELISQAHLFVWSIRGDNGSAKILRRYIRTNLDGPRWDSAIHSTRRDVAGDDGVTQDGGIRSNFYRTIRENMRIEQRATTNLGVHHLTTMFGDRNRFRAK